MAFLRVTLTLEFGLRVHLDLSLQFGLLCWAFLVIFLDKPNSYPDSFRILIKSVLDFWNHGNPRRSSICKILSIPLIWLSNLIPCRQLSLTKRKMREFLNLIDGLKNKKGIYTVLSLISIYKFMHILSHWCIPSNINLALIYISI